MTILEQGQVQKSFDDAALTASTGTVFALPAQAVLVTWQISFGTAPSAIHIDIETSLDNSNWNISASSTDTAGEIGSFATSALFIRATIASHTDGDTVTVTLVAKLATLFSSSNNIEFQEGKGLIFNGSASPVSMVGGDDGGGDTTIILSGGDGYQPIIASDYLALGGPTVNLFSTEGGSYGLVVNGTATTLSGNNGGGGEALVQIGAGSIVIAGTPISLQNDTEILGILQAASYKSGDGSAGIDTTITTASLVGKTITVKDGLITGFA